MIIEDHIPHMAYHIVYHIPYMVQIYLLLMLCCRCFRRDVKYEVDSDGDVALSKLEDGKYVPKYSAEDITSFSKLNEVPLWHCIQNLIKSEDKKTAIDAVYECDESDFEIVALALGLIATPHSKKRYLSLISNPDFIDYQVRKLKDRLPEYHEEKVITCVADVLRCAEVPPDLFWIQFAIQTMSALAFSAVLTTIPTTNLAVDFPKAASVVFAGVSFAFTSVENLAPIVIAVSTHRYLMVTNQEGFARGLFGKSFGTRLLQAAEVSNMVLLCVTSVYLVPHEDTPLDIILNCTALFAITQVGDQMHKVMRWKV